jgi:hypothetical protein
MSGSGGVVVVSIDRSGQGGSIGGGYNLVVAVLAELWWLEDGVSKKKKFFCFFSELGVVMSWRGVVG